MAPFGSLSGHHSLKTAWEIKSDLRFEISDLNYLDFHVYIAYMVWALLTASEASTASKHPRRSNLTSDLKTMAQTTYVTLFELLRPWDFD